MDKMIKSSETTYDESLRPNALAIRHFEPIYHICKGYEYALTLKVHSVADCLHQVGPSWSKLMFDGFFRTAIVVPTVMPSGGGAAETVHKAGMKYSINRVSRVAFAKSMLPPKTKGWDKNARALIAAHDPELLIPAKQLLTVYTGVYDLYAELRAPQNDVEGDVIAPEVPDVDMAEAGQPMQMIQPAAGGQDLRIQLDLQEVEAMLQDHPDEMHQ